MAKGEINIKKYIIIIFTTALILRLLYTFIPQVDYFRTKNPVSFSADVQYSDGGSYVLIAKGFLKYGYPSRGESDGKLFMAGGFLYPLLLSINLIFSNNLFPLILLQIILDSLIPVLIFLISFKYVKNKYIPIITSLGYALYYPNFLYARNIGTDSLYIFFLFLSIFWFLYNYENLKIKDYFMIGALFSITSLIRAPVYYPFIITLILVIIYFLVVKRKIHKGIILALVAFCIVQLPMLIICYRASGSFIAGSTGGNVVLMIGTYLPAGGDNDEIYLKIFPNHPQNIIDSAAARNNWSQIQKDSAYSVYAKNQIMDNFTNHTFESIKVMGYQFSRFWFNFPYYNPPSTGTKLIAAYNGLLLVFFIIGLIISLKKINKSGIIILIGLFFYQGLHLFVFSLIRYSAPLIPLIFLYTGFVLFFLIKWKLRIKSDMLYN